MASANGHDAATTAAAADDDGDLSLSQVVPPPHKYCYCCQVTDKQKENKFLTFRLQHETMKRSIARKMHKKENEARARVGGR